jgi:hypothetical protein
MSFCNARKSGRTDLEKIPPGEQHGGDGYCKRSAGAGTTHKGEGRCKHHDGRPVEHGYYSKYLEDSIGDRLDQLAENESILELRKTIAAQQQVLMRLLEQLEEDDPDPRLMELLNTVSEGIGRNRKRLHSIEEGQEYTIHIEQVQHVITKVVDVVSEEVDPDTAGQVGERLSEEISL